jgi:hypothetical protein
VYRVASEAGVPAKLAALGVRADATPSERSSLVSLHRKDPASSTDYYYFYNEGFNQTDTALSRGTVYEEPSACRTTGSVVNPCRMTGEAVDQQVTLRGQGTPYLLDATTGKITPIADYTTGNGTVTVRVALGVDQSTIIALSTDATRFGAAAPARHVIATTADQAEVVGSTVVLRDTTPGTYTATLSDGTTVSGTVTAAAARQDLTGARWDLAAEDWKNANPIGATGAEGAAILKEPVSLTLDGLAAWPDIAALANASGVGTYTTTVDVGAGWTAGGRAVLSLGQVVDTVKLTVNGTDVPVDQLSATADVGPYLRAGSNTLTVRVSTTLNNRLATLYPAVATRGIVQEYGLVGPVTLTPYGQVAVPLSTTQPPTTTPTTPTTPAQVTSSVAVKVRPGKVVVDRTRARLKVSVTRSDATAATGIVTVKVRGSKAVRASVRNGVAKLRLPRFGKVGSKLVRVTYAGPSGVEGTSTTVRVRVRR